MEENAMAKDRKPAEDLSAFANQGMAQARNAVDTYFDFLKTAVSSTPSGGTEFGERLKSYAEANLATTHEFVRQLSQAKDLNEMVRIQTEFMQSLELVGRSYWLNMSDRILVTVMANAARI
jgi:hypothetical protein